MAVLKKFFVYAPYRGKEHGIGSALYAALHSYARQERLEAMGRRRTRRRGAAATGSTGAGKSDELAKMRDWGRANGFKVSSRGRVSQELQDAYAAAH